MTQAELLGLVVAILDELKISHMLVGSHASSYYGEPRSTHDVDLVIDLDPSKISEFVSRFDSERYYFSESALREGRMANLIDTKTGDKVDCFILRSDPIDQLSFSRRRPANVLGINVSLASPEDTILSKLSWSQQSGGSRQQMRDVNAILKYQLSTLDLQYLREQAERMGIRSQLEKCLDESREA